MPYRSLLFPSLIYCLLSAVACSPARKPSGPVFGQQLTAPVGYEWPDTATFKVLSWNAEHFIDQHDDPYIRNGREDNPPANMQLRRSLMVKALRKANADIVLFQEFESAKLLQQLAQDSLADMGYRFFADAPSPTWYMNVVAMSRFPMGALQTYGNVTTPLPGHLDENGQPETQSQLNTRMWSATFYPAPDYAFTLTGVHLKAGRSPRDVAMRKGQIQFLIGQYNQWLRQNKRTNLMMAGDFNATPNSEELALLTKNKALIQPFIDPIDTAVRSHPADNPTWRLDYMIVNPNMLRDAVPGSVGVQYFFGKDTMRLISDHLPVMGTFYRKDN